MRAWLLLCLLACALALQAHVFELGHRHNTTVYPLRRTNATLRPQRRIDDLMDTLLCVRRGNA